MAGLIVGRSDRDRAALMNYSRKLRDWRAAEKQANALALEAEKQKGAMAVQGLSNQGALERTGITEAGATGRTQMTGANRLAVQGLSNQGALERTGITEAGATGRTQMTGANRLAVQGLSNAAAAARDQATLQTAREGIASTLVGKGVPGSAVQSFMGAPGYTTPSLEGVQVTPKPEAPKVFQQDPYAIPGQGMSPGAVVVYDQGDVKSIPIPGLQTPQKPLRQPSSAAIKRLREDAKDPAALAEFKAFYGIDPMEYLNGF